MTNATCIGVVYKGSLFHNLCYRRADKSGFCKMHRKVLAEGKADAPPNEDDSISTKRPS